MSSTFGAYLKRFALSVDVMDDATLTAIGTMVEEYVGNELQIEYFEVMTEALIDDQAGLTTMWTSEADRNRSKTVLNPDGQPRDQTALSYHRGIPLWVVADEKSMTLAQTDRYLDLWSGASDDLPTYVSPSRLDIQTSIIVPLNRGRRKLGVIYLESVSHVEITEVAKGELQLLADAIALLCLTRDATATSRESTGDAIKGLTAILASGDLPRLAKPQVFVASSSGSDQQVVGTIMTVLSRFGAKVTPVLWSEVRDSGPIDRQIVETITRSRFGVCYMSEPAEDLDPGVDFQDNPNVLFEAGMLHSLTNAEVSAGWIPIREEKSTPPPFDFAHERIEIVPRLDDGQLNRDAFEANLSARMESLLEAR